jgi:hypothetical protein
MYDLYKVHVNNNKAVVEHNNHMLTYTNIIHVSLNVRGKLNVLINIFTIKWTEQVQVFTHNKHIIGNTIK